MEFKRRFLFWVVRLFTYWGLLEHPYGREYARKRYTPLGGRLEDVSPDDSAGDAGDAGGPVYASRDGTDQS